MFDFLFAKVIQNNESNKYFMLIFPNSYILLFYLLYNTRTKTYIKYKTYNIKT